MVVDIFDLIIFLCIFRINYGKVETLNFESACLKDSNVVQLRLRCSLFEHVEIIRVIYGYSKQRSTNNCQFSIYDCIQEGTSEHILSCNGKQTCVINITKNEILSTTAATKGVPVCPDFNYVQVNYGCVLDAKDICDSWKEEGAIIHVSHTNSKDKQYNECQCKVKSSLSNGQVLLHAKEFNRQYENLKELKPVKNANVDCKTTTYLEITTDRSERKCMDNLPQNGNALFGSGSHNFTLNYIRNDPLSELYFYFELTASPIKSDHYVQIICNWARRTTTIRTTLPMARKRKLTTINMSYGRKLSRLDLIRHPSTSNDNLDIDEDTSVPMISIDETETTAMIKEFENEDDEKKLTNKEKKTQSRLNKRKKTEELTTMPIEFTTEDTLAIVNDDEWSRMLSKVSSDSLSSSEQYLSSDNESSMSSAQVSVSSKQDRSRIQLSKTKLLIMSLLLTLMMILILSIYFLKVARCGCLERLKINLNIALLFCCEAGKVIFSSSNSTNTSSNTPTSTIDDRERPSSLPDGDYRSADYYTNGTVHNFHPTDGIYEYDYDYGEKSAYNIDYYQDDGYDNRPPRSMYTTQYDRYSTADTC